MYEPPNCPQLWTIERFWDAVKRNLIQNISPASNEVILKLKWKIEDLKSKVRQSFHYSNTWFFLFFINISKLIKNQKLKTIHFYFLNFFIYSVKATNRFWWIHLLLAIIIKKNIKEEKKSTRKEKEEKNETSKDNLLISRFSSYFNIKKHVYIYFFFLWWQISFNQSNTENTMSSLIIMRFIYFFNDTVWQLIFQCCSQTLKHKNTKKGQIRRWQKEKKFYIKYE